MTCYKLGIFKGNIGRRNWSVFREKLELEERGKSKLVRIFESLGKLDFVVISLDLVFFIYLLLCTCTGWIRDVSGKNQICNFREMWKRRTKPVIFVRTCSDLRTVKILMLRITIGFSNKLQCTLRRFQLRQSRRIFRQLDT